MNKAVFVSAFTDKDLYSRCALENPFIRDNANLSTADFDNSTDNRFISKRYNQFLDTWDYSHETWFVFCHSDWEILEDITTKLAKLDKGTLWGPIGAKLIKNDRQWLQIYCGTIQERSRDGNVSRTLWNRHSDTGTPVDTFDSQCMIVHSTLVQKFSLRFDESYKFDLYVEDFCINAAENFGIPSKILRLDCRHNSISDSMNGRDSFYDMVHYFNEKWASNGGAWGEVVMAIGKVGQPVRYVLPRLKDSRATIYKRPSLDALIGNPNDAMSIAFDFVEAGSRVLDAGCAAGDLGVLLHDRKTCRVFGMDYNADSVEIARATGKFEDCRRIDLDSFNPTEYQDIGQFDYIILGDVCEHLRNPVETLLKLKELLAPGGAFCLSIPNVAHASVKAALLLDRWDYMDVGLMDRTHIHMFSWKGIARELADATLAIERVKPTFFGVHHMLEFNPFLLLPATARRTILKDIHSYVGQYVMICRPSNNFDVEVSNRRMLDLKKNDFRHQIKKLGKHRGGALERVWLSLKIRFYYSKFRLSKNMTRQRKFTVKIHKILDKLSA